MLSPVCDKHYSGGQGRYTVEVLKQRMSVPREERIEELKNQLNGF